MTSGIFLLFGIGILGGILSSTLLKKTRVPQVLGYLIAGLIIGQSGFNLINAEDIEKFHSFSTFALAVIGLLVGAEIKTSDFKRYGRQFFTILIGEGFGAFILVSLVCGGVLFKVTGSFILASAGGIIFGAISSATDPASTISVLWEKKAAGILTTTITAVIALDDALALLLYGLCSGIAQILVSGSEISLAAETGRVALEIFGAVLIGLASGVIICRVISKIISVETAATSVFGLFLLSIAISDRFGFDIVITALITGIVISNNSQVVTRDFIKFMKGLASPVYVLFFVFTGARLTLGTMPVWLWVLAGLFVFGRSAGKAIGAYAGGTISNADTKVKKYTGLGLLSQGGVAIGLAVIAGRHLENITISNGLSLGDIIITGITTTTFFIQLIGPAAVGLAVRLAGEQGRRVTFKDLIESKSVSEVMPKESGLKTLSQQTSVNEAIEIFSQVDDKLLPVVDSKNNLLGIVTFESLRQILSETPFWKWSLVDDVMDYQTFEVNPQMKLSEAFNLSRSSGFNQLPVADNGKLVGLLDMRKIENSLKKESINMQEALYEE